MAVPVLKLNLAPPSNLWRTNHVLLSWAALGLGAAVLAATLGLTALSYRQASTSSRRVARFTADARVAASDQARIMDQLRGVDVTRELPRWRLAERIITERSLPWSRLTAELERSLVNDVRLRSIQRTRGTDRKVQLKLRGEARSRAAEADFVESLEKNPFFEQVILERENERQGGGVDFDYTLAASSTPPAYKPLPKYGPKPKPGSAAAATSKGPAGPVRPGVAVPGPLRPAPAAPLPARSGVAVPARPAPAANPDDEVPPVRERKPLLLRRGPAAASGAPVRPAPSSSAAPEAVQDVPSELRRPRPGLREGSTP
jgi:hypothetical protein